MNIGSILIAMGTFAGLVFVGLLVLMLGRSGRQQSSNNLRPITILMLVASILFTTIGKGLVFLQADEYGVVISPFQPQGYRTEALGPGLHWIIPFVESVQKYSIARQTYTMSSATSEGQVQGDDSIQARTKDGQQVYIDASVIYAVDPTKLIQMHILWQNRYEENVVRPVARAAIRDAVSQFGVEEIVSSKRTELEHAISDKIRQSLADNNIIMSEFLLRNIRFSDEYAQAVEQKQIAEQQAQQAKFVVEQKKQEAEQARQVAQGQADAAVIQAQGEAEATVIKAQGEAEATVIKAEAEAQANKVIAESLTPELIQYIYVTKIAPGVQTIFIPTDQQFILPLPTTPTEESSP